MKLLATIFITLILAVSVALFAMENPGYILVAAGKWTLESTLSFAIVVLVATFIAGYFVIRFISRIRRVPGGLRYWQQRRKERKAMVYLTKGLIDLAEGHWHAAEKKVTRYVKEGHAPLLNYLAAARAAQGQGADQRRDHYLKLAHESHDGADIAVGLTQAELQLQHNQLEQALATMTHLQQLAPKHSQVLKVLALLYRQLGDWERLLELMPMLARRKIFSSDELDKINRQAYLSLLLAHDPRGKQKTEEKIQALTSAWLRIPKQFQSDKDILLAYVNRMLECGGSSQVEPLIRYALKRHRDEQLIRLYGLVQGDDSSKQLAVAESLLVGHENDAIALLAAGRLSLRNKLWGKARSYLEASVHASPSAEAYNELGHLLEKLGEQDLASSCYQNGLRLAPGCENTTPVQIEKAITNSEERVTHEVEPKELASSESEALNVPAELQAKKVKVIT
ncbi:heme biosynthesis HemY N-terminal domain-containing protein [Kaarinaea lacus]